MYFADGGIQMNKILVFAILTAMFLTQQAYAQSRPECLLTCPRIIPNCINGHSEKYSAGTINECTLKDEIYCLELTKATDSSKYTILQNAYFRIFKQNEALLREVERLLRLLKFAKLTGR